MYKNKNQQNQNSGSGGIVRLDCTDKDAQIRYTLDGTIPSDSTGLLYKEPILVSRTMLLYMQAFNPGIPYSQIVSSYIGSDIYQQPQLLFLPLQERIWHPAKVWRHSPQGR